MDLLSLVIRRCGDFLEPQVGMEFLSDRPMLPKETLIGTVGVAFTEVLTRFNDKNHTWYVEICGKASESHTCTRSCFALISYFCNPQSGRCRDDMWWRKVFEFSLPLYTMMWMFLLPASFCFHLIIAVSLSLENKNAQISNSCYSQEHLPAFLETLESSRQLRSRSHQATLPTVLTSGFDGRFRFTEDMIRRTPTTAISTQRSITQSCGVRMS